MYKELDFLHVEGYYGGNQERFLLPMMRMGGCSTVCACHAAALLARKDPSRAALCPLPGLRVTEKEFFPFARKVFRYVHPMHRGMPETRLFEGAFSEYAGSVGVEVSYRSLQGDAPWEEARDFFLDSIDRGLSVQFLMLHHSDPAFDEYLWHWFTLTGYERREGELSAVLSTLGRRRVVDFRRLWEVGDVDERGGMLVVE